MLIEALRSEGLDALSISSQTHEGLDGLREAIVEQLHRIRGKSEKKKTMPTPEAKSE